MTIDSVTTASPSGPERVLRLHPDDLRAIVAAMLAAGELANAQKQAAPITANDAHAYVVWANRFMDELAKERKP